MICARLILQELHLLLELELSDLFLAAKWVVFLFDLVQFLLSPVQLLLAWLCCETGATCCLVPKPVELPLRLIEFLGALEMLKLFALVEFVYLCLLGRLCPLFSELVGRRPEGGRSQKKSGQQKTCSNGPAQFHQLTSFAF